MKNIYLQDGGKFFASVMTVYRHPLLSIQPEPEVRGDAVRLKEVNAGMLISS